MKVNWLLVVALCAACIALGLITGVVAGNSDTAKLETELEMLRDERAYVVTSAERDARMLNAKTEMLEFVRDNLTSMLEVIDTYRTAVYDMSIRIRELEAE